MVIVADTVVDVDAVEVIVVDMEAVGHGVTRSDGVGDGDTVTDHDNVDVPVAEEDTVDDAVADVDTVEDTVADVDTVDDVDTLASGVGDGADDRVPVTDTDDVCVPLSDVVTVGDAVAALGYERVLAETRRMAEAWTAAVEERLLWSRATAAVWQTAGLRLAAASAAGTPLDQQLWPTAWSGVPFGGQFRSAGSRRSQASSQTVSRS